jgi:hypothetical protein
MTTEIFLAYAMGLMAGWFARNIIKWIEEEK